MVSRWKCPSNGWSHGNRGMWCVAGGKLQPRLYWCPVPAHHRYTHTHTGPSTLPFPSPPALFIIFSLPLCSLLSFNHPVISTSILSTSSSSISPVAGNIVEEPDIHLILEYPSGASWGHYTSRRANRYVLGDCLVEVQRTLGNHKLLATYILASTYFTVFQYAGFSEYCESYSCEVKIFEGDCVKPYMYLCGLQVYHPQWWP